MQHQTGKLDSDAIGERREFIYLQFKCKAGWGVFVAWIRLRKNVVRHNLY